MLAPSESGPNRWTAQRGLDARDGLLVGQIPTEMGKPKLCLGLLLLGFPMAALSSSAGGEAELPDSAFTLDSSPFSVVSSPFSVVSSPFQLSPPPFQFWRNMGLHAC